MEGRHFAAGEHIKYVDFGFYEILDILHEFDNSILSAYKNLDAFWHRFREIP